MASKAVYFIVRAQIPDEKYYKLLYGIFSPDSQMNIAKHAIIVSVLKRFADILPSFIGACGNYFLYSQLPEVIPDECKDMCIEIVNNVSDLDDKIVTLYDDVKYATIKNYSIKNYNKKIRDVTIKLIKWLDFIKSFYNECDMYLYNEVISEFTHTRMETGYSVKANYVDLMNLYYGSKFDEMSKNPTIGEIYYYSLNEFVYYIQWKYGYFDEPHYYDKIFSELLRNNFASVFDYVLNKI